MCVCVCVCVRGMGTLGKPLHFKGSNFHRIIPGRHTHTHTHTHSACAELLSSSHTQTCYAMRPMQVCACLRVRVCVCVCVQGSWLRVVTSPHVTVWEGSLSTDLASL